MGITSSYRSDHVDRDLYLSCLPSPLTHRCLQGISGRRLTLRRCLHSPPLPERRMIQKKKQGEKRKEEEKETPKRKESDREKERQKEKEKGERYPTILPNFLNWS
ncbi:hypothetical protein DACRYDRAFT_25051 [Dacryopinax primogenitus]|uniref:Uncharacterized protein n=1 Tax=Dacryopinax primogenitus (strain DJM 731) TaxID=1858805 RepID=M5FRR4_DACPD|nr:uncharacterized protein DACRYDRAFT_25051 [Dacryopinax primogenitus]EJT97704.1 hypothetical protein DACRYDRAFT_25051 [Dacryopinax primogenitus]